MDRASGTDRASRSSFGTTSVSPARAAARAWSIPGRAIGPAQSMVGLDALRRDAERLQRGALGREVLLVGRAAGVADQKRRHSHECAFEAPSSKGSTSIYTLLGTYQALP